MRSGEALHSLEESSSSSSSGAGSRVAVGSSSLRWGRKRPHSSFVLAKSGDGVQSGVRIVTRFATRALERSLRGAVESALEVGSGAGASGVRTAGILPALLFEGLGATLADARGLRLLRFFARLLAESLRFVRASCFGLASEPITRAATGAAGGTDSRGRSSAAIESARVTIHSRGTAVVGPGAWSWRHRWFLCATGLGCPRGGRSE